MKIRDGNNSLENSLDNKKKKINAGLKKKQENRLKQ